ncbi:hypothetical protein [Paenibacillus sp. ov031]|nr:hypothetical protein [Paenibacillus sp. ov031]
MSLIIDGDSEKVGIDSVEAQRSPLSPSSLREGESKKLGDNSDQKNDPNL